MRIICNEAKGNGLLTQAIILAFVAGAKYQYAESAHPDKDIEKAAKKFAKDHLRKLSKWMEE